MTLALRDGLELGAYVLAALVVSPCVYMAVLALAALFARLTGKTGAGSVHGAMAPGHLVFVVPAHNEEADIESTLQRLCALNDDDRSIHVIADNCNDRTAELVRQFARTAACTVRLWERHDETKKAKGYALAWALPRIYEWATQRGRPASYVCIVDADAALTAGSAAMARQGFAAGHEVLQSEYIFGKGLGLRAEVMRIASAALVLRGLGRSALGLSDTLKGNGMWFRREVLEETPWCAYSLAEDLEYTMLIARKGHRVHVMAGSQVSGKLAATREGESEQRLRWEGGRLAVVKAEAPRLLRELLRRPSWQTLDLLLELVLPPLALLVVLQAMALAVTALLPGRAWLVVVCGWLVLGAYILLGVALSGLPARTLLALGYVPFYVAWKVLLLPRTIVASRSRRWVRTARDPGQPK